MGMNGLSEDLIPQGYYCYSYLEDMDNMGFMRVVGKCPYWKKLPGKYDARCEYLNLDDIDGALLWDQVKICGVRDYEDSY